MIIYQLAALFLTFTTVQISKSCEIPHEPKTRVFHSLQEYQSNKIPFKFGVPSWKGSDVDFNFTIEKLQKNGFIAYDSQSIITLYLTDKKIKQIDEGAFISLSCLHRLYLNKNNITSLSKKAFEDLYFLEILDLSGNYIGGLENLIFSKLHQLQTLNLSKNQIKTLQSLVFRDLIALKELNLEYNRISMIPDDIFQPLITLTHLNLAHNHLEDTEMQKWGGLLNLTRLNMSGNALHKFEATYNLSYFELNFLDFSFNNLTQLNVTALLKQFPKLRFLDINDNAWSCNRLNLIVQQLKTANIGLIARNDSTSSVNGIGCNIISTTSPVSTTTPNTSIWVDKKFLENYVEKKIQTNNERISSSISTLETFVIISFIIISLVITYEIYKKTNSFRNCRRRPEYLDASNAENFRLLNQ